jgi:hypothetical protein
MLIYGSSAETQKTFNSGFLLKVSSRIPAALKSKAGLCFVSVS